MSNVLSKMKMRTPNCSAFPVKWTNKISNRIGNLVPIKWIEMGPNDRCKLSLSQLTRFFPLSAPAMANFRLTVDAVFVPSRIISKKYEKFFNAGTKDSDRPPFPSITFGQYINLVWSDFGLFKYSLLDFLGYPTFENCKSFIRKFASSFIPVSGDVLELDGLLDMSKILSGGVIEDAVNLGWLTSTDYYIVSDNGQYYDTAVAGTTPEKGKFLLNGFGSGIMPFVVWLVNRNGIRPTAATASVFYATYVGNLSGNFTFEDAVDAYLLANNLHIDDVVNDYLSYVAKQFAENVTLFTSEETFFYDGGNAHFALIFFNENDILKERPSTFLNKKFSLLPIFSFWKCYFDWYVNSVLENGQELTDEWSDFVTDIINNGFGYDELDLGNYSNIENFFSSISVESLPFSKFLAIPTRLWSVDRFTGAYTDLQNGQPVLIPVDGTMLDLKASNRLWQYLQKALYGGTRTIDKNEIIYGAHSSNQLLDRTEVLCRKHFDIDIQQVSNTAASEAFDLGTLAGQGFGLGGDFLFDYTCEERGYIMVFASVTVPPSYISALDRTLMHTDYYDFFIPEFDGVGEVEIGAEELYFDKGMRLDPIGYNRRNYEGIDFLSEVHGDFKNSLKHWHDARDFKVAPTLSPEFIHINVENDNLERLFATYSHDQIMHFFAFKGVVVRPMSKFVQFGL